MPTYDYQCTACAHPFTAMHKISDPVPSCPSCGGSEIQKLLSAPAVHGRSSSAAFTSQHSEAPAYSTGGCGSGLCGHKH